MATICGLDLEFEPDAREDRFCIIYTAQISSDSAGSGPAEHELLDPDRIKIAQLDDKPNGQEQPPTQPSRVDPYVQSWQEHPPTDENGQPVDPVLVIVSFPEHLSIPRFPSIAPGEAGDSQLVRERQLEAQEMANLIRERRSEENLRRTSLLEAPIDQGGFGATVVGEYWLVSALIVSIRLERLPALAAWAEVQYIAPVIYPAPPRRLMSNVRAATVDSALLLERGRRLIGSDPYFRPGIGASGGKVALLDSGVRFSHEHLTLLNVTRQFDCTAAPGASCVPRCQEIALLAAGADCQNHGTHSAAVVAGRSELDPRFTGVSGAIVDSFVVYRPRATVCSQVDVCAVLRGIEDAVTACNSVILVEIQPQDAYSLPGCSPAHVVSVEADNAFDTGVVIVAPNGNHGISGLARTVDVPANGHKVIGVGAFEMADGSQTPSQSLGPTSDNRVKPDVQAPTGALSAWNGDDTGFQSFPETSGAAPFVAGVAALVREWLQFEMSVTTIDPGQVNAFLILSANPPILRHHNPPTFSRFDGVSGGGRIALPHDGTLWWGKAIVIQGASVRIPLILNGAHQFRELHAAIWWPESETEQHNDIDLELINPGGDEVDSSRSSSSVFERVRAIGPLPLGEWSLGILGYRVPSRPQRVYWCAFAAK